VSAIQALHKGGAIAQTTSATITRTLTFAPVGLANSETAQVNLVNLATNPASGNPASCAGSVSFLNAAGSAIGSATPFTVTSGQIASVKLAYSSTAASGRTVVRAVVTQTLATGSSAAPCALATSLETYDSSTGVTHAYVAGPEATSRPGFGQ
jgi:hypothetical protein